MEFHRRRKIEAQIDMTPMIDTLLQLFMIFLLTATFVASSVASSVQVALPKAAAGQPNVPAPIVISMNADQRLFLNDQPVERAKLKSELKALLAKEAQATVLFRADRQAPYEAVLKLIVDIREVGVNQVNLAYQEESK